MSTTLTSKSQVTIPKSVRDHLGIGPGSKVDFQLAADGNIVLLPAAKEPHQSRFRKFVGHSSSGLSTDEIMALTRGET
jgi:antitoxin PrlF